MKFLDLSGYMFSGKHAVIELMREFSGYYVPPFAREFDLIRIQDGIIDLEKALVESWSPVRIPAAVSRFREVVEVMARPATKFRVGFNCEEIYGGKFRELAKAYLDALVDLSWSGWWPYAWGEFSTMEVIRRKSLNKLGMTRAMETELCLCSGDNFLVETRRFLSELLQTGVPEKTRVVVMHNALEPFNPSHGLRYFSDAQCIVVHRDPRDNYVASLKSAQIYRRTAGAHDPYTYIKRYRLLRRRSQSGEENPSRVLRIQYEDLIWKYEHTVSRIREFLGESAHDHVFPKRYFRPEESAGYVGMWKTWRNQEDIREIARELAEYCVDR